MVQAAHELADYVAGLKQRSRKVVTLALRQLLRPVREYPREPLLGAVREAGRYGLYDLDRLERMILRRVTREYFLLLSPNQIAPLAHDWLHANSLSYWPGNGNSSCGPGDLT